VYRDSKLPVGEAQPGRGDQGLIISQVETSRSNLKGGREGSGSRKEERSRHAECQENMCKGASKVILLLSVVRMKRF
jgi:hypothetical protein